MSVVSQTIPEDAKDAKDDVPEKTHHPRLICSPTQWYKALQYMHNTHDSFIFYNCDHTIRFMIRTDADDDKKDSDSMYFDICIMNDKESAMDPENFENILKMDSIGYFEDTDESTYYIDTFFILRKDEDLASRQTLNAMQQIEKAYSIRLCGCGSYLIKDATHTQTVCYMCMFAKTEQDLHPVFCPICMDHGPLCHMNKMKCCAQMVHKTCLGKWLRNKDSNTCPLCRQFNG